MPKVRSYSSTYQFCSDFLPSKGFIFHLVYYFPVIGNNMKVVYQMKDKLDCNDPN